MFPSKWVAGEEMSEWPYISLRGLVSHPISSLLRITFIQPLFSNTVHLSCTPLNQHFCNVSREAQSILTAAIAFGKRTRLLRERAPIPNAASYSNTSFAGSSIDRAQEQCSIANGR